MWCFGRREGCSQLFRMMGWDGEKMLILVDNVVVLVRVAGGGAAEAAAKGTFEWIHGTNRIAWEIQCWTDAGQTRRG